MNYRQWITSRAAHRLPILAAAAAGLLALAGCASPPPPPTEALQAAESAISSAEQARVASYASAELTTAREKLRAANAAVREEEMIDAQWLALESAAHAETAQAKAEELQAKEINDEMRKSIETLKQEMQRASGGRR